MIIGPATSPKPLPTPKIQTKKFYAVRIIQYQILPIHCPTEGRVKLAPIPAPTEAKKSEAQHPTVAPETFLLRILTCFVLSTFASMAFLVLETEEKNW